MGGGQRYELRVFPKGREFALRREPGGGGFPATGSDPEIGRIGELNRLRLTVIGSNVKAHVNGKKVADVNDGNRQRDLGAQAPVRGRDQGELEEEHRRQLRPPEGVRARPLIGIPGRRA